jgi:cytoskeletal protein CcmA (bactofilin family)
MGKNKDVDMAKTSELNTILGKGSIVKGDLIVKHGMRVDGTVEGTLEANGFLVIGKEGMVEGEIKVANVVVGGKVSGNINASGKVLLEAKSSFHGDMKTSKLVIEEGAVFEGKCSMEENPEDKNKETNGNKWDFQLEESKEAAEPKIL